MCSQRELLEFLKIVDEEFPIPLSQKVDLKSYAYKLCENAQLCILEENHKIEALVAGYTENLENGLAYISVVAVIPEKRGNGYASKLVSQFIDICREKNIPAVHLHTHPTNSYALRVYKNLGFEKYSCSNETKPNDIHLIYWIRRNL